MNADHKIYVAGHRSLVGSALMRSLRAQGHATLNLPDEHFVPLLGQDRNDGLPPLMNIGVGHDLSIRELAETVRDVLGYQGAIEFDTSKPDGTPRKLMDVGRLNGMGWTASTSMRNGLPVAYADFIAPYARP